MTRIMAGNIQRLQTQTRYCLLASFCQIGGCTEVFATALSVCMKTGGQWAKASTLACIHACPEGYAGASLESFGKTVQHAFKRTCTRNILMASTVHTRLVHCAAGHWSMQVGPSLCMALRPTHPPQTGLKTCSRQAVVPACLRLQRLRSSLVFL